MEKELKDIQWREFRVDSIFDIENCKCSNVSTLHNGNFPYVGATNRNNGVIRFVEEKESLKTKGNCIAFICDGEGSIGYSIYKQEDFIGSTTVKVGRNMNLNRYTGSFITTVADKVRSKYNFGFKRNDKHLRNEILLLPINSKGEPDYVYMEQYMRKKEQEKIDHYKEFITELLKQLNFCPKAAIDCLVEKNWKEFYLRDYFNIEKGNQNNMSILAKGNIPLVSAKKGDNGYKDFVSVQYKKIFPQHCLTLNNDGDGGAGISFYQPYKFALDSHVTALFPKISLNKYTLLFISRSITSQRNKFGHGYSLTNKRLKVFKLMLPVNKQGNPDYKYMEQYMKRLEYKKLKTYLDYLESKSE